MPTQTPARRFKNAIYEQFARVSKALASPHRIELVELLSQGPAPSRRSPASPT